jgi:hypothetical protein
LFTGGVGLVVVVVVIGLALVIALVIGSLVVVVDLLHLVSFFHTTKYKTRIKVFNLYFF